MKKEYSYGAVIYKKENNDFLFLIEHMTLGHNSLCKGHIEKGETEIECALREIKEETNLNVILDTNFRYTITYSPQVNIIKDVTFFIATIKEENIIVQKEEVLSTSWLDFDNAIKELTFDTDKEVLKAAYNYLNK